MGDKTDQVKGRIEEAAGVLTDDQQLQNKGKRDRIAGEAKEKLAAVKDKVEDAIDAVKDKVEDVIDDAKKSTNSK